MNFKNIYKNYIENIFFRKYLLINKNGEINILIDGIICMELVSTYYIALLYSIQFKLNKKICLYIAIDEYKKKYHINNRIFSKYFKTKFILIDKKNRYNEKKLNNYFFKKNLFNCDFEKNIYSGYVRIREVGTCNVDEKSYKKFFYNWVINFIKFQSILKKLDIKYLFISDCVYHNFGLLFKTALLQNIKVVATIPYDQSGLIGGRVYLNASNYFRETRNYLLSFTNKTLEEIQNNLKPNLINDFVQSRINGNQKIFDGSYHRNTKKMTLNEIDLSFNKKIIFHKKILIACHLLWDDSNSSYTTLYEDYEIWLSKTIDCAIINTNVLWIFKAHPSEIYLGTKRTIKDLFIEKNTFFDYAFHPSIGTSTDDKFAIIFNISPINNKRSGHNAVVVFPNPVYNGEIIITIPSQEINVVNNKISSTVEIINSQGVILKRISPKINADRTLACNVEDLPIGIYTIKTSIDGIVYFNKLVKQ